MLSNGYHLSSRCSTAEDEGDICCVFLLALPRTAAAAHLCASSRSAVLRDREWSVCQAAASFAQTRGGRTERASQCISRYPLLKTNSIFTGTLQGCDQTEAEAPLMVPGSGLGLTTALSVSPVSSLLENGRRCCLEMEQHC